LDDIPFFALRAFPHWFIDCFGIFTIRETGASQELTEPTGFNNHRLAANIADFIGCFIGINFFNCLLS
jgi:hypothetical protein